MADKQVTPESFLADVTKHVMTVKLDNGLYRHLMFRQPQNSNLWFEIVTWSGSLSIHGDMGTWEFSRVEDMFTFFRSRELKINASYWQEKIDSESRFGGPSRKFHADTFKKNVLSSLDEYDLVGYDKSELLEALEQEVFNTDDEPSVRRSLAEFKFGDFEFTDSWEIDGQEYTYHFLWCLHAIVWAIQQYDAIAKEQGNG